MLAVLGTLAALAPPIDGKPLLGYLSALLFVASAAMLTPLVVHYATFTGSGTGSRSGLRARTRCGGLACVAQPGRIVAQNFRAGGGAGHGHRDDDICGHHGGQFPADGVDMVRQRVACGPLPGPCRSDGRRSASHHCAGGGGPYRGDTRRGEREPPARLRNSVPGPPRLAGRREPGSQCASPEPDLLFAEGQAGTYCASWPRATMRSSASRLPTSIMSRPATPSHSRWANKRVAFRVIDIFYDYGHEAGYIVLDWGTLLRYLPDSAPTNLAVYLAPGADLDADARRDSKGHCEQEPDDAFEWRDTAPGDTRLRPDICHYVCGGGDLDPGGDWRGLRAR